MTEMTEQTEESPPEPDKCEICGTPEDVEDGMVLDVADALRSNNGHSVYHSVLHCERDACAEAAQTLAERFVGEMALFLTEQGLSALATRLMTGEKASCWVCHAERPIAELITLPSRVVVPSKIDMEWTTMICAEDPRCLAGFYRDAADRVELIMEGLG